MCGIFGFYLNRPLKDSDIKLGLEGVASLKHRGPDTSDYWTKKDEGIFLGHTRLSIIDLSDASNQPMICGDAILAYNGELYNYRELRDELRLRGFSFSTTGDAEVILKAWLAWGESAPDRFDGMFAFAIYRDQKLHLAIDPFGEKPLYWIRNRDGFYFSSEPAPLVRLLKLEPELDEFKLASFMSLGYVVSPYTAYKELYRFEPATYMVVNSEGIRNNIRYWNAPSPDVHKGVVRPLTERQLDEIHEVIVSSVKLRLVSDAPIGIFLSAGVDSSLVAAITKKELGLNIQALTVSFPEGQTNDEAAQASDIARYLDIPHIVIDSRKDFVHSTPEGIFQIYGELNDNLTAFSVRQMSALAKPYIKVALSGMGGDELFYGYNKYQLFYHLRYIFALPYFLRKGISAISGKILPNKWPMKQLHNIFGASDSCRFLAVKNYPTYNWLSCLNGTEKLGQYLFPDNDLPLEIAARYFDLNYSMPNCYIPAMERGSMKESLEVRTPYLNRKLVETISNMDQRAFIAFGQKSVLRRLLQRYLPKELFDFPKQGFIFPQDKFLEKYNREMPEIPYIAADSIKEVWTKRYESGWRTIAVRIALLESFYKVQTIRQ